jgi:hypothetical protein
MFLKKLFTFLFILLLSGQFKAFSQGTELKLAAGDKAFEAGNYAEALKNYELVLHQDQQYSEAMLLKMAFIKEKEKDIPTTLYYLQMCYAKTTREAVLQKIIELAEENNLKGHKPTDIRYLFFLFEKHIVISVFMALFVIIGMGFFLFKRGQKGIEILFPSILLALAAITFLYVYDFGKPKNRCLVKQKAILMDSPSAGAVQIDMIDKGHCLDIIGKNDIWYKVDYEDKIAYVRESNVWLLP